jgi:hypothetical protein
MSRHNCWNCDYRLDGDPSRCPRCGMPLAGLEAPRQAAATTGVQPARKSSRRKAAPKERARPDVQPRVDRTKAEPVPPGEPVRSNAARFASGAGKGLRAAATGAGRSLLATFGFARKTVATGTALSVRTARIVGSAAGSVASGARAGGTRLVAHRPKRARVLEGDILQRENVRTISDVAERLLREAREENARLAARIAALEAHFAADRKGAAPSGAASRKKPAAAGTSRAPAAPRKASATAPKVSRVERAARREPETAVRPVVTIEAKAEPAVAASTQGRAPAAAARPSARRKPARPARPAAAAERSAPVRSS